MNDSIDYAEMLEIPVETVNVVQKKPRLFRDWKALAVGKVNERVKNTPKERDKTYAGNEYVPEQPEEAEPLDSPVDALPVSAPKWKTHPVIVAEFAVACALVLGIFLTNVFMPQSGINTFIRTALGAPVSATAQKTYADFTLSGVVSEYADVDVEVASDGVLSFTGVASVYPACEGTVSKIAREGETYSVTVAHSDTFTSVYTGLTSVYANEGTTVYANVPLGYSNGEKSVSVGLYQGGEPLNCYFVDAQNCLSWNK